MDKIKLGIAGLGRLGRKHAENIHYHIPEAELTAVCSVVQGELDSVAEEMHPEYITDNYSELLSYPLDGIVIAASSQEHCSMICQAALAGRKYVYTEKPLGMSLKEIDKIKDSVRSNKGMKLQIGYNRRFDSSIRAAKKKTEEGFVGKIIQVHMINRDPAAMADFIIKFSPKSGGLVMDMLTHDYDLARWFVGSEAKSVYGIGGAFVYEGLKKAGDIDNCSLLVEFKNGVIGQFETSRNSAYGYHVEMEIYGSKGNIRVGMIPLRNRVTYMNAEGINFDTAEWFYEYWEPTFLSEIKDFIRCIRNNQEPLIGLEDGYRAVEWAVAATEAVKKKNVVFFKQHGT